MSEINRDDRHVLINSAPGELWESIGKSETGVADFLELNLFALARCRTGLVPDDWHIGALLEECMVYTNELREAAAYDAFISALIQIDHLDGVEVDEANRMPLIFDRERHPVMSQAPVDFVEYLSSINSVRIVLAIIIGLGGKIWPTVELKDSYAGYLEDQRNACDHGHFADLIEGVCMLVFADKNWLHPIVKYASIMGATIQEVIDETFFENLEKAGLNEAISLERERADEIIH